jgi:quercetin dioxygenase-like cupin family protein
VKRFAACASVLAAALFLASTAWAQQATYVERAWTGEKPTSQAGWKSCSNGTCLPISDASGVVVRFQRREQTSPIEGHEHTTHVWYVIDGEATLITGGEVVGRKEGSRPGEFSGTDIRGGTVRHLRKGDVIVIPPRTPHWWKEIPSGVGIFQVNIGGDAPASAGPNK